MLIHIVWISLVLFRNKLSQNETISQIAKIQMLDNQCLYKMVQIWHMELIINNF